MFEVFIDQDPVPKKVMKPPTLDNVDKADVVEESSQPPTCTKMKWK
jgi:hypothetical protein